LKDAPAAVAVLVPTLDEERYIAACVESLLAQRTDVSLEVLVLDGGSRDATRSIVGAIAERDPRVRLLDNPGRLQSAACNLGATAAAASVTTLIRADAHAVYQPDFVATCTRTMAETGATSVVVPLRTEAEQGPHSSGFQRSVAAAQRSRLGNGGSAHRTGAVSGWVDHGHHAAFDRRFFTAIGGYDAWFTPNEDAEFDVRAVRAGGRIWLSPQAAVTYFPRRRVGALARQYANHGGGRARTLLHHRLRPKARQCAPLAILALCAGGVALAPLRPRAALAPAAYVAACSAWGAVVALRTRDAWLLAMGPAAIVMHLSWAVGFARVAVTRPVHPDVSG
jgi:succinoglycan biosynthesis protein ExoA